MTVVLLFSLVLLLAVLLSALAQRTVLSTAVLFLAAGYLAGPGVAGLADIRPEQPLVGRFVELALVTILFIDGLRLGVSSLRDSWRLPGRALLLGLPLTLAAVAVFARWLLGVSWPDAWLVAAALSPTDPVFASALFAHPDVPARLRHLLNVESGLNDGLTLPIVVSLLAVRGASAETPAAAVGDVVLGVAIGVGIAWAAYRLRRLSLFDVTERYAPLGVFAIGLLVLAAASLAGANEFLAAFPAGVTLAALLPRTCAVFEPLGEPLSEILKLATVLLFGIAVSSAEPFTGLTWHAWIFAALVLVMARPLAIMLSLAGTRLPRAELAAAAWFGPKGFSSVFLALMILKSGIADAEHVFRLLALTVAVSMVVHSSTDVLVTRWFSGHRGGHDGSRSDSATERESSNQSIV